LNSKAVYSALRPEIRPMDILKPDLIWIEGRCYRLNIQNSFLRGEEDRHFADDVFEEESMLSTKFKRKIS